MKNYILEYNDKIQSGEIAACEKLKQAYIYLSDLVNGKYSDYHYNPKLAEKVITFIETFCTNYEGKFAGKPVELMLWEKAFLSAIFAIVDRNNLRKFREALLIVARKNGKSLLCAAIACYLLFADGEAGGQIYCAASKKDQAKLVWNSAKNMIQASPFLLQKARLTVGEIKVGTSIFKPLARDSNSLDGLNASGVIIDELHCLKTPEMYNVLSDSMAIREQPLTILITTAGTVRGSIYDTKYADAEGLINQIEENRNNDNYQDDKIKILPIIYELDNWKAELSKPEMWIKANPGLGVIKSTDYLEQKIEEAKRTHDINNLLTKHFDIRRNATNAFFVYDELNNPKTFDMHEVFDNRYVVMGMDLSKTDDLTALTMLTRDGADGEIFIHSQIYMPAAAFEKKVAAGEAAYNDWYNRGFIRLCTGSTINHHDIYDWFVEMMDMYHVTPYKVGYDSWSAKYIVEDLENLFGRGVCIPIIQGYKTLSGPLSELHGLFNDKKIVYNNNPVFLWCCLNVTTVEDRNGNQLPDKRSKTNKIDAFASFLDAYTAYSQIKTEFDSLQ